MSTYPAYLSHEEVFSSGEGSSSEDANTAQWHKVESKNTKRLKRRQAQWDQTPYQVKVIKEPSKQPPQNKVKLFSCALSTLNTFAEAQIAAVRWKNETRPRVTVSLDGIKVDLLYDTGAQLSCLSKDTYDKCFSDKPIDTNSGYEARAAGNFNLNVIGTVTFWLQFKDQNLDHEFLVCQGSMTTSCPSDS